jgi:hypothetical protein
MRGLVRRGGNVFVVVEPIPPPGIEQGAALGLGESVIHGSSPGIARVPVRRSGSIGVVGTVIGYGSPRRFKN